MQHLIEVAENLAAVKVALVGDYMLDRYLYGDAERISPEAPVPVLRVQGSESRPGGAGGVAAGILALGGRVHCIGVLGRDAAADELLALPALAAAETAGMLRLRGRVTTVKQRLVGLAQHRHRQQMLRMDEESSQPLPTQALATVRGSLRSALSRCQLVVLEDYDKGVLTDANTPQLIDDARGGKLPVVVDPARIRDYRRYRGASLITPNRFEAELASGIAITDEPSLARCAARLSAAAEADAVLITLDKEGAYLARREGQSLRVPTRPRTVYDVSGAGDAVVAMLAVAVGAGADLADAAALANVVGGLEVERFGVVPIRREELLKELRRTLGLRSDKVVTRPRLAEEVARIRAAGGQVIFTNGCFDLLHMGHVRCLQQARRLGSCLIVAINADDSARRLKGHDRPVTGQNERAEMLAALECVDYVTIFDEDTPEPLLELLRPDVLAKGGTTDEIVGQDLVEGYGGKVVKLDLVEGLSTTKIIDRILSGGGK